MSKTTLPPPQCLTNQTLKRTLISTAIFSAFLFPAFSAHSATFSETLTGEVNLTEDTTVTASPGISTGSGTTNVQTEHDITLKGSSGINVDKNGNLTINADKINIDNSGTGMFFSGNSTSVINANEVNITTNSFGIEIDNGVDQNITINSEVKISGTGDFAIHGGSNGKKGIVRPVYMDSLTVQKFTGSGAVQSWRVFYYIPEIVIKDSSFSGDMGSAFMTVQGDVRGDQTQDRVGSLKAMNLDVAHSSYFNTLYFQEGEVNLNEIEVSDIRKSDTNGLLSGVVAEAETTFNVNTVTVKDIHGIGQNVEAYGMQALSNSSSRYGNTTVDIEKLHIEGITSDYSNAFGLYTQDCTGSPDKEGKLSFEAQQIEVSAIKGGNNAIGIWNANGSTLKSNNIVVDGVTAGGAYGYQNELSTTTANTVQITNISGNEAVGLFNLEGNLETGSMTISGVQSTNNGNAILLDTVGGQTTVSNSATLTHKVLNQESGYEFSYQGAYQGNADTQKDNVREIAIRSIMGGKTYLNNEDGQYLIAGTILAGRGTSDSSETAGSISLGGKQLQIYGDVFAGNGGQIDITLNSQSKLEGQIDDYHELNSGLASSDIFRNPIFSDAQTGVELPVTQAGKVTLNLNGGQWIARGQSFVNTINLSNGGTIDLSKNSNSSVSIANLSGSGNFTMELGAYSESGEIQSDMLYIQNVSEGSHFTINAKFNDTIKSIEDLVDLRFATVGSGASADLFSISIIDEGFYNHSVSIGQENYQIGDADNERFNGTDDGKGEYKPGENAIDAIYGEETAEGVSLASEGETSQNYFIKDVFGSESGDNSSLSDAGSALLATARGTYWTSVEIDRLTNRMGDARYANNGDDGLWIRLRQSCLGTDTGEGDFKSDNTVYQVGYDHAFQRDGGRQLVGVAFDYMDTDLDYKGISGEGNTDRYGITAYTTWLADNGFYVDVVGKWGRLDNDFDIINGSGGRVKADYDNNMWAISAEVGRKLSNPKTGMFIEPNAQLQYTMVTDAQYSTNQGTRVDQDRIDSVIGRMGVRIGRAFDEEQNHNIYAKADMFREFMGEQKIHVKDVTTRVKGDTITVQNKGFWFDVGGGFQSQLGRDAYAYADVEYRFGNDLDKSWIVNAGMRYEF